MAHCHRLLCHASVICLSNDAALVDLNPPSRPILNLKRRNLLEPRIVTNDLGEVILGWIISTHLLLIRSI